MPIYLEFNNELKCINDNCNGGFIIRRNKKDDIYFMGCSKYPKCNKTISVNYYEAFNLGIYRDDTKMDMIDNLSENEVLNHFRHLLIHRELGLDVIGSRDPSNIDYDKLNGILKFDSKKELGNWIRDEIDEGNIDDYWHNPLGSPYSMFLIHHMLPNIKNQSD